MKIISFSAPLSITLACNVLFAQTWPVNSADELSSAFGARNMSQTDEYPNAGYDYDFHAGTDIGATYGSDVRAIESGTVVKKGTDFFVVESSTYFDWIRYTHVAHSLDVDDTVIEGNVICQIEPLQNHLDVKYYPLGTGVPTPYNETDHYNYTHHPMTVLPYSNYDTEYEIVPTTTTGFDETGTYVEFYLTVDDDELDLIAGKVFLEGDGYTTFNILKNGFIDDNYVDLESRMNCGDSAGEDMDEGVNNEAIRIIPRIFDGGQWGGDPYQKVYSRFYLNESVVYSLSSLDVRVESLDVGGGARVWKSSDWIDVTVGTCPPNCPPPGTPDAPTNLFASTDDIAMSIDLNWDQTLFDEGFYVIYRRPSGTDPSAYQVIDITGVEYYHDIHFTSGAQYYYTVAAVNQAGESLNSNEMFVTAPTNPPPATPTGFYISGSTGQSRPCTGTQIQNPISITTTFTAKDLASDGTCSPALAQPSIRITA